MPSDAPIRPRLAERGPWDFVRWFPSPLPGVVESGRLQSADGGTLTPADVESIHRELFREGVALLRHVAELKRRHRDGLHPSSGKKLAARTAAKAMAEYPTPIRNAWRSLVLAFGEYEACFGREANRAFKRFCIASYTGVMLVTVRGNELRRPRDLHDDADGSASRERRIRYFDLNCPSVWVASARVWNLDRVGGYHASGRAHGYDPGHPFYYQMGGTPIDWKQIEADAEPATVDRVHDAMRTRSPHADDWQRLAERTERELADLFAKRESLMMLGPIALPDGVKHLNAGQLPVSVWAEAMAMLYRQSVGQFAIANTCKAWRRSHPTAGVQLTLFA
jgi:hypothetical protein